MDLGNREPRSNIMQNINLHIDIKGLYEIEIGEGIKNSTRWLRHPAFAPKGSKVVLNDRQDIMNSGVQMIVINTLARPKLNGASKLSTFLLKPCPCMHVWGWALRKKNDDSDDFVKSEDSDECISGNKVTISHFIVGECRTDINHAPEGSNCREAG